MKLAWLYKEHSDDKEWHISFEEPPSWVVNVRQIVYAEVERGRPE